MVRVGVSAHRSCRSGQRHGVLKYNVVWGRKCGEYIVHEEREKNETAGGRCAGDRCTRLGWFVAADQLLYTVKVTRCMREGSALSLHSQLHPADQAHVSFGKGFSIKP